MAFAEKLKKFVKPRAFLFKLVATILVFICIPLLVMQIFVIGQSTDEFRKSNQERYFSILQTSASTFVTREDLLSQTALRISLNESVQKPLRHSATEYTFYEAAQALKQYGSEILHCKSVGVYYISKGFLLINGYKFTLEDYCKYVEPEKPEAAQKLQEFFTTLSATSYYPSSDNRTFYIAKPISLGAVGRQDGIAFFVTDAEALEESYRASVSLHSSFAVVNKEGVFLVKGKDFAQNMDQDALSAFLSSSDRVSTHGDLLFYRYTDPESGFSFLLSVDKDESQEQLLIFAQTIRVALYIMVALIIVSLTVTIYINYLPIHRLLQKHTSDEEAQELHSELERLDSAFFNLDAKNTTQQALLENFILGDLLFGNAVRHDLLQQYFPAGHYNSFTVMTALCPAFNVTQSNMLVEKIEAACGHSIRITNVPSRPHTVIICLATDSIDADALMHCTSVALAEVIGTDCPLCIGQIVTDIYDLRSSYRDAVTSNLSITQDEADTDTDHLTKKLQELSQCVYIGDEDEALNHLSDIKHFLYNQTMGEGQLRYCGFKLLHSYLTSINSGKSYLSNQEVELLLSFSSMDHLFKLLGESIHQVCCQIADNERTTDVQLQQSLLQYVDAHFIRSDLCLTNAADHVGTSIYAVSRLFKEITGKGFKEYVTDKRLEYGHTLLCTTSRSIADIATTAGFENANYFSTVFKLKYGTPPTKYRNALKNKQKI